MSEEPKTEDPIVAALLREREGLVQRGLTDRIAQVDEQLKARGYKPDEKTSTDAPKAADGKERTQQPKARRPRRSETA